MEKYWLIRKTGCGESRTLIVFVLGWASDYHAVQHFVSDSGGDYDMLCLYDFRSMDSGDLVEQIMRYRCRYLVGWSFGVWVAEQLFDGVTFTRAVAFNGSPVPSDLRRGIGSRRLNITLQGIKNAGMSRFIETAYGEYADFLSPHLPPRSETECIDELEQLIKNSSQESTSHIDWQGVVIGDRDVIFPVENMVAYWGERAEILPLPHYPFRYWDVTKNLLHLG